ncbi:hypothetical protein GGG16DRAFT_89256 [Schizophyllum commune]
MSLSRILNDDPAPGGGPSTPYGQPPSYPREDPPQPERQQRAPPPQPNTYRVEPERANYSYAAHPYPPPPPPPADQRDPYAPYTQPYVRPDQQPAQPPPPQQRSYYRTHVEYQAPGPSANNAASRAGSPPRKRHKPGEDEARHLIIRRHRVQARDRCACRPTRTRPYAPHRLIWRKQRRFGSVNRRTSRCVVLSHCSSLY